MNQKDVLDSAVSSFSALSKTNNWGTLIKKVYKPTLKQAFFPNNSKAISKPKSPDVKRNELDMGFDVAKMEGVYSPKIDYLFFDFPEGKLSLLISLQELQMSLTLESQHKSRCNLMQTAWI